jgi:DNA polymerase-3 subunit epsilon
LLDAQLLAQVYVELTGGRQIGLGLVADVPASNVEHSSEPALARPYREPRPHFASAAEVERHGGFLARMKKPLWERFLGVTERGAA